MSDVEGTQYGFKWMGAEVVRLISDDKAGCIIEIKGKKRRVEVWVSPAGTKVRVHRDAEEGWVEATL